MRFLHEQCLKGHRKHRYRGRGPLDHLIRDLHYLISLDGNILRLNKNHRMEEATRTFPEVHFLM